MEDVYNLVVFERLKDRESDQRRTAVSEREGCRESKQKTPMTHPEGAPKRMFSTIVHY